MSNFFDNLCRTLATPMPRSRALKLIAGGLAGAVIAPFAFGQGNGKGNPDAGSSNKCPNGQCGCNGAQGATNNCCPSGSKCFSNKICCPTGKIGVQCGNGKTQTYSCYTPVGSQTAPSGCTALSATC
jgi:hypothetical protein